MPQFRNVDCIALKTHIILIPSTVSQDLYRQFRARPHDQGVTTGHWPLIGARGVDFGGVSF